MHVKCGETATERGNQLLFNSKDGMYTDTVNIVTEQSSVMLMCVNDSPSLTGDYGKKKKNLCGCDLLWSDAGWDTTQRLTLRQTHADTRKHTSMHSHKHNHSKTLLTKKEGGAKTSNTNM